MAVFAQLRRLIHHKSFSNITAKLATFSGKSKKRRTEKKKSSKRKRNLQIQTVFVYKYGQRLVHEKMTRLLVHPLVVAAKNACERLDASAYVTRQHLQNGSTPWPWFYQFKRWQSTGSI